MTTPPPMPEIDAVLKLPNEIDGNLEYHNAFTEAKVLARDAEWMERCAALEADRKMLREALEQMLEYSGIIEERCDCIATNAARTALENTHD